MTEVAVSLCVGEKTEDFSYRVVDEETGTVAAALVGERGGKILGKLSAHQLRPVQVRFL